MEQRVKTSAEENVDTLLKSFLEVAQCELGFANQDLLQAIVDGHEQYMVDYPDDDDDTRQWRIKVIEILKRAIKEIDDLG